MKRVLPVLALTVAGLVPLWRYEPAQDTASTAEAPSASTGTASTGTASTGTPSTGTASPGASSRVVTGPTVSTEKGDVQVEVTFAGDRIGSVRMLKQPNDPQTAGAVPTLIQETLTAQSADIDTVSGATITSEGYLKSLQAALDEA